MFFVEDPRWRDALVAGGGSDGVAALQAEIGRVKEDLKKMADQMSSGGSEEWSGMDTSGSTGNGEKWSDM